MWTKLKGMTFDHDIGYFSPPFFFPSEKRKEEKENELAKIVIKSNSFPLGQKSGTSNYFTSNIMVRLNCSTGMYV